MNLKKVTLELGGKSPVSRSRYETQVLYADDVVTPEHHLPGRRSRSSRGVVGLGHPYELRPDLSRWNQDIRP